jgi:hypothetical protein
MSVAQQVANGVAASHSILHPKFALNFISAVPNYQQLYATAQHL